MQDDLYYNYIIFCSIDYYQVKIKIRKSPVNLYRVCYKLCSDSTYYEEIKVFTHKLSYLTPKDGCYDITYIIHGYKSVIVY